MASSTARPREQLLANEAGLSKGGLVYYFGQKEHLIQALIELYTRRNHKCPQECGHGTLTACATICRPAECRARSWREHSCPPYRHFSEARGPRTTPLAREAFPPGRSIAHEHGWLV